MATNFTRETPDLGKPQLASPRMAGADCGGGDYGGIVDCESPPRLHELHAKSETVFGLRIKTPDSSRWAHYYHSRILQKLPFLVEMFYWIMNYLFYSVTKGVAQWLSPAQIGVVQVARDHAIDILNFEHNTASWVFPIQESDFQSFSFKIIPPF
ncbi:uncharacterized protein N7515_000005 [Penicillium bovifimosum]|uniref:Uncharacterized protein n=1 Tax=Penicillium bovifimosum TaxID=126998 RepID=A0A9W9HEM1_9EURO|nr:uncharacterized protein N7515_000005 [Penicillium bovifimosum]KAJ5145441.1 hypothetical protein N7515_000005 [Penicillium bovifimosum]